MGTHLLYGESQDFSVFRVVTAIVTCLAMLFGIFGKFGPPRVQAAETATQQETQSPATGDDVTAERIGRIIPIHLPITGPSSARIKQVVLRILEEAKKDGRRLVLIFRFETAKREEEYATRSEFGACYDLADFLTSEPLGQVETVAYVPYRCEGHAVLVTMACNQVFLAPDAEWGAAGIAERRITPPMLSAYRHMAERRRTVPVAVALGMLDAARSVLLVETDVERLFVDESELDNVAKTQTLRGKPSVVFSAGQFGRLTGREARALDVITATAADSRELLTALGLKANLVEEERFASDHWRAVQVDVSGPITAALVERCQRLIEEAVQKKDANFVCVRIDSAGGSPSNSLKLATYLAADLDPEKVRTVAYIPEKALADAALIAVACDQIVMDPNARLGGEGNAVFSDEELARTRRIVREVIAKRTRRSWSLLLALVDGGLEVSRVVRKGLADYSEYLSEQEMKELEDAGEWEKKEVITTPGRPLQLSGKQAVEYGLANETVESFAALKSLYGLENDPALLEPTWVDSLVRGLASPYVAVFLLIIGGVALLIEVQTPGIGIGAFLAAVCFVLFFWSRFLGGTVGWLEILLFSLGSVCLLLEIFIIPGFGICGLGGGLLVLVSLVLASQTFIIPRNTYQWWELQRSLLTLVFAGIGIAVLMGLLNRWLPKTPGLKHLMLMPPSGQEAELQERRRRLLDIDESFVGSEGLTVTVLLPSGKARFGQRVLDVISQDGDPIEPRTPVVVTEVRGNRIYVRPKLA